MARSKDYYALLGVPRNAAARVIKYAYYRLVKRLHPDVRGAAAAATIHEVQAAYETLSDAERRRSYDAALASADADTRMAAGWPAPAPVARTQREACVAELLLTRREARLGGVFPLRLPMRFACPSCAASGGSAFPCEVCDGEGFIARRVACDLRLPPGVRDGAVFELRVQRPVPTTLLLSVTILAH
jgi:DnaJ-class molecular chaperone